MSLIFYPFEEGTARDIASAIQFFKAQTMTQNYPFKLILQALFLLDISTLHLDTTTHSFK